MRRLRNAKSVQDAIQLANKSVDRVLHYNPDLLIWAKEGPTGLAKINDWFEEQLNAHEKIKFVRKCCFANLESDLKKFCEDHKAPFESTMLVLCQLVLHRQLDREVLANMICHRFKDIRMAIPFLMFLEKSKIIFFDPVRGKYVTRHTLDKGQEIDLDLFQNNLPMLVPPRKVRPPKEGDHVRNGYRKIHEGIWTKKARKDEHKIVSYDVLNMLNHTKYRINFKYWYEWGIYHEYLPERDDKDDDDAYNAKLIAAHVTHFRRCFYFELLHRLGIEYIYVLSQFGGNGRNYPIGFLVNPQDTDVGKAFISFEPEEITPTGFYHLACGIARDHNEKYNGLALDKHLFNMQARWYREKIRPLMFKPYLEMLKGIQDLAKTAECPCQFVAKCINMHEIYQERLAGKPGMVYAIVHFDDTCSGYQKQALFCGDVEMMKLTNLLWTGKRQDLYTNLHKALIKYGLPENITRLKLKKKCLIPAVYNCVKGIKDFLGDKNAEIFNRYMMRFPMWRMNRDFPKFWDDSYTNYKGYHPDGFMAYISLWKKHGIEMKWGDEIITLFEEIPGTEEYSCALGPFWTQGADGFDLREVTRSASPELHKKAERIRRWMNASEVQKIIWRDRTFNGQPHWSVKKMQNLLALDKMHEYYSFNILSIATKYNWHLVPPEILERLLSELTEHPFRISPIHDSYGIIPNYAKELIKQKNLRNYYLYLSQYLPFMVAQYRRKHNFQRSSKNKQLAKKLLEAKCSCC